jgi:hypothetical protein
MEGEPCFRFWRLVVSIPISHLEIENEGLPANGG